jgi:hypothetical protein
LLQGRARKSLSVPQNSMNRSFGACSTRAMPQDVGGQAEETVHSRQGVTIFDFRECPLALVEQPSFHSWSNFDATKAVSSPSKTLKSREGFNGSCQADPVFR